PPAGSARGRGAGHAGRPGPGRLRHRDRALPHADPARRHPGRSPRSPGNHDRGVGDHRVGSAALPRAVRAALRPGAGRLLPSRVSRAKPLPTNPAATPTEASGRRAQPLTEPAVSPWTMYFWKISTRSTAGSAPRKPEAAITE